MKAILRKIRISPKKANLVAGTVRGKKVNEALNLLKFMPKKAAKIIYKVVQSAASNAKNNFKQSMDELIITEILVTKGPTYKRSIPISRGRAHPIRKRTSHITVEVGVVSDDKKVEVKKSEPNAGKKEEVKKDDKKTVKKEEKVEKKSKTDEKETKKSKKE